MSAGNCEEKAQEAVAAISGSRLLPVVVIDDAAAALPLASALKRGGLRCVEITLRTSAAEMALRAMAEDRDLMVGAGTVLNVHLHGTDSAGSQPSRTGTGPGPGHQRASTMAPSRPSISLPSASAVLVRSASRSAAAA